MKTFKVTYRTSAGKIFRTIVPVETEAQVTLYMINHYDYSNITIIAVRPSVKIKYAHYTNITVK